MRRLLPPMRLSLEKTSISPLQCLSIFSKNLTLMKVIYGANRIKRVLVVLQNVMLYVIRVRVLNYAKIYSGGLSFKSDSNLGFCLIVFILNILIETIVIGNIYYYWALKCLISYCYIA